MNLCTGHLAPKQGCISRSKIDSVLVNKNSSLPAHISQPSALNPFPLHPCKRRCDRHSCRAIQITTKDGKTHKFDQERVVIGSGKQSDLQLSGDNIVEEHAAVASSRGRVTCTALGADPDDFLSETYTWVNGNPSRPGVAYVLDPGDKIAVGSRQQELTVQFEAKSGESAALQMMMQSMIRSDDVKAAITEVDQ